MASVKQLESYERKRTEWLEKTHKIINGIDHKICNQHEIFFPEESPWLPATLEYFYNNKLSKTDGLSTWCKKCSVTKSGLVFQANRERSYESHRKYQKTDKWKAYSKRNQITSKPKRSEWRRKNPDKLKEYAQKHRIHDITEPEWRKELEIFDYRCAYCGITEEESLKIHKQKLHKDHSDNKGYNDLRNAIPACRSCNSAKHEDSLDEWYPKQEFFTQERYNKIQWWINEGYKYYIENKPPYRIIRKRNEGLTTYHFQLWTVDEKRNIIKCIETRPTRKELIKDMENGIIKIPEIVIIEED